MIESREQLLAQADECERLAQLADTDHSRRRQAALSRYWVALAGAAPVGDCAALRSEASEIVDKAA